MTISERYFETARVLVLDRGRGCIFSRVFDSTPRRPVKAATIWGSDGHARCKVFQMASVLAAARALLLAASTWY